MENSRLNTLLKMYDEGQPDSFILFAIAKEWEALGDPEKAIIHYEKLRSFDPKYTGLYYHLAALYAQCGNKTKAMEIYDLGIAISGEMADYHAKAELMNARTNLEMDI